MTSLVLAYVTCADADEAGRIADVVVGERLAACANILPGMQSVYWWQGKLERAAECVLILKTRAALAEALTARVRALHSYRVPCVAIWPLTGGNPDYFDWLLAETS